MASKSEGTGENKFLDMDQEYQEYSFETIVDVHGLEEIRAFIEDTLILLKIDSNLAIGVLVAVNELTTNIFEHGYGKKPGPLRLTIGLDNGQLWIRLWDEAFPFDFSSPPDFDAGQPLHERSVGGMGIRLARSYVDDIIHRPRPEGGNEVLLVFSNIKFS